MLYGLAAALGWGIADLTTAIAARRLGSVLTTVVAQVVGLIALAVLVVAAGIRIEASASEAAVLLLSGAFVGGLGYLAFYRALELGPIALVSPIVAAYAAITIVLAVVLLRETLEPLAVAGVLVTLAGVFLAAMDFRALKRGDSWKEGGIPLGLVAMVLFGFGAFVLGRYAQPVGWAGTVLLARSGVVIGSLVAAVIVRRSIPRKPSLRGLGVAVIVGLGDVAGMAFFAKGSEVGSISITSAAAAAFILIPVIGGLLLFKERPIPTQILGIFVLGGGLVLLGLGQ